MIIGTIKETSFFETRTAITPQSAKTLINLGYFVLIEKGCGKTSGFSDNAYRSAGAKIISSATKILSQIDILLKISPPSPKELSHIKKQAIIISDFQNTTPKNFRQKSFSENTFVALNKLPRLSKYQPFDILTSQNSLSGYQAVLSASNLTPRAVPMMITAAGTIPPLKFLIIGTGIAGLQAIATAKRLGGKVFASDPKPEAQQEIESLGAIYLKDIISQISDFDIIITSAFSSGKRAPLIIGEKELKKLSPETVLIDMACANGGNIIGSKNHKLVRKNDCIIYGNSEFATLLPHTASTLFANNFANFISHYTSRKASTPTFNINHPEIKDLLFLKG